MSIYPKLQITASKLLAKFKQGTIQLVKTGAPVAGTNEWDSPTNGAETTYTLDAIADGVNQKYVDGETVLATDLQITSAVFAVKPLIGDKLIIDGQKMTIIKVLANPSAGLVCNWILFAR